jgi:Uma2 family endonuclease
MSAAPRVLRRPLALVHNGVRLLTAADLAALPEELPSGTVQYELDNGRLVIMPPPGEEHGGIQLNIGAEFKFQLVRRGEGRAWTEVGIILRRNPDRVVGADVAFVPKSSLPTRISKEGYLETIPSLIVEIRSKNDSLAEIARKVKEYLKAGVKVVWVVDPGKQSVTAYRRGRKPKVFAAGDTLTIEDVVPGFRMPVAEVFRV